MDKKTIEDICFTVVCIIAIIAVTTHVTTADLLKPSKFETTFKYLDKNQRMQLAREIWVQPHEQK